MFVIHKCLFGIATLKTVIILYGNCFEDSKTIARFAVLTCFYQQRNDIHVVCLFLAKKKSDKMYMPHSFLFYASLFFDEAEMAHSTKRDYV